MASPRSARGGSDRGGWRWRRLSWRCPSASSASHCQSRSPREVEALRRGQPVTPAMAATLPEHGWPTTDRLS